MKPINTYADWSFFVGTADRVASPNESDHRVGTTTAPMPWLVAFDGQDSLEYARNAVAAAGEASAAVASAGGEDVRESDSSCAHFNSALTIPLPNPHNYQSLCTSQPSHSMLPLKRPPLPVHSQTL
jgi:hypothetical protein